MQTDRYTKFILTVIAFGLIANLLAPLLKPTAAIAQGSGKKWSSLQSEHASNDQALKQRIKEGYEPFAVNSEYIYFRK